MKKIIWTFEKEDDYNKFSEKMRKIPVEAGFIESENDEELVIKIINLE